MYRPIESRDTDTDLSHLTVLTPSWKRVETIIEAFRQGMVKSYWGPWNWPGRRWTNIDTGAGRVHRLEPVVAAVEHVAAESL